MSWSDDIRCLFCDGKLPLYRKITNGQFCSTPHRKAYWAEQERLAVERLHQTHDSIRAYMAPGAIQAILGEMPTPEEAAAEQRIYLEQIDIAGPAMGAYIRDTYFALPQWLPDSVATVDMVPLDVSGPVHWPVMDGITFEPRSLGSEQMTPLVHIEPRAIENAFFGFAGAIDPKAGTPGIDDIRLALDPVSPTAEIVQMMDQEIPGLLGFVKLPAIEVRDSSGAAHTVEPIAMLMRAQLPLNLFANRTLQPKPVATALLSAGLTKIEVKLLPAPLPKEALRAIDLRTAQEAPQFTLSTPPRMPRLKMAAGRRYPVETKPAIAMPAATTSEVYPAAPQAVLTSRAVQPIAAAEIEPGPAGMVSLACNTKAQDAVRTILPAPSAWTIAQPMGGKAMLPQSKLQPVDSTPSGADVLSQPMRPPVSPSKIKPWAPVVDFWNRAPRDLKMLVFALPILLGLALNPALPKVRVAAPKAANGIQKQVESAFSSQWVNVKQSMVERAAVALDEDFRSGLDDWATRGDATAEWSFDATGFVRPGSLALYRPSMNLSDYQVQFLGVIDKQALSWVVRAKDFDNFYVVKLVMLKSGPLPTIGVTRYSVVDGKADARVDTVAPIGARADQLYRVMMDVHGDDFALSVQGQLVDSWSEPRLRRGGIGFFSARGEQSRLRWVQITHQYDMLGRLCAYLAPYNMPAVDGGSSQQ